MKNTLGDLNNYLFAQIERLDDEQLSESEFDKELKRAKAINGIASAIINNARVVLEAKKFKDDSFESHPELPKMLEG